MAEGRGQMAEVRDERRLAASAQSDRKRNSFKRKLDRINRIIGIERPSAERVLRRSYYDESQVKIYIFFVAQILETLLFDNSVKPGQILLNLLIE